MKVYTKTGDTGTTSLFGGDRVPKHHIRIESYGTVDELNSYIGLLRDQAINPLYQAILIEVQDRLFTVGAILATPPEKTVLKNGEKRLQNLGITEMDVAYLENEMDKMDAELPPMTHFVLPGGHPTVSYCHIARCVCRRAERLAVHLNDIEPTEPLVITYLNRLSDFLFVLARKLTQDLNATETPWIPRK
ncbi:cob(I)yrinic acid a,c-diamide adenosyltransferase [Flavobacterium sp.]|jgi:cob(I)alamin adenosyltransferase|uniref:cob(I)yrinic acid a,c-diamide adenosyltransferase n=1 Tax=Flavobacterium sp. TaxID=239 RepID=UPI0022C7D9B7|nr:cob(I)yrinic acid a,c-diamide adenosyltransferase [Flavobacterium sp.]MCZ8144225.1 cob(I)yrinic acid a,c-diamide adenosyltransferase [Flavobacterium sp.]MCZ8368193.1 cob(I)yrinic acid a,c-diamide adenosyltransferase [Flavobacterium sp.]